MDIINLIAEFVPETITLMFWLLFLSSSGLIFYWIKNRNKYLNYSHEIPESLIRDYHESLLRNIQSQRSDIKSDSRFASVLKVEDVKNIDQSATVSDQQINKLMTEIIDLRNLLESRESIISQLESKVLIKGSPESSDIDNEELERLRRENNELYEKLKEFELIEDDLVMLRDLKVENEDLRKKLGGGDDAESAQILDPDQNDDGDDELHIISGHDEEAQGEEFVRVSGEEQEEDKNDAVLVSPQDEPKRGGVKSPKSKNFGSVKVKDGSLFGRWDSQKKTRKIKRMDAEPKPDKAPVSLTKVEDVNSTEQTLRSEIEVVGDLGDGADIQRDEIKMPDVRDQISSNEEAAKVEGHTDSTQSELAEEGMRKNLSSTDKRQDSADKEESGKVVALKEDQEETDDEKKAKTSLSDNDKSAEELLDEFEKMLG